MTAKVMGRSDRSVSSARPGSLFDPALAAMIDLNEPLYSLCMPDVPIDEASGFMDSLGITLLLIVSETQDLLGVLSRAELHRWTLEDDGPILIEDLLPTRSIFPILELEAVSRITVGDVLSLLRESPEDHALIAERNCVSSTLHGAFSVSHISAHLGFHPDVDCRSFKDLARFVGI